MEYSKFNPVEIVLGSLFFLLIDGLSALLDLIPVLGGATATVMQAGVSFASTFWLMSKGGHRAASLERQLIKHVANFLPFVPTLTISFAIETALHNNPRLAEKVKKVSAVKPKIPKAGALAALGAAALLFAAPLAYAQEEALNLFLTWRADSFYPSNYLMKAPAVPNSQLTISLAAVENGRFVDLSSDRIEWYYNGKYLKNGTGLTRVSFGVDWRVVPPGGEYSVRALVYRPGDIVETSLKVPVKQQDVVLDIPRFGQEALPGSETAITAVPFFFNVDNFSSLRFEWSVEDAVRSQKTAENVLLLNVDAPPVARRYIPIGVRVTNALGLIEWAEKRVNILTR